MEPLEIQNKETIRFVEQMNKYAAGIGMSNSTFVTPSGLGINGIGNKSTARDLAKLCVECSYNEILSHIWCTSEKTIMVNDGEINVLTSFRTKQLSDSYPVLGGKTGSNGVDAFTLVCLTKINGMKVAGAVMGAMSNSDRFVAMKQLFDCAKLSMKKQHVPENYVTASVSACALMVPPVRRLNPVLLYEQNADTVLSPMSTTKLLSVLTALDYINDLNTRIQIAEDDLIGTEGTSGSIFNTGDIITINDLLYAILLPSSNQGANALARYVGGII